MQSENIESRFQMCIEVSGFEVMLAQHHLACLLFSYSRPLRRQTASFVFSVLQYRDMKEDVY